MFQLRIEFVLGALSGKLVGEDVYESFALRTWWCKWDLSFSWGHQYSWWCLRLCFAHLMFQVRTEPFVGAWLESCRRRCLGKLCFAHLMFQVRTAFVGAINVADGVYGFALHTWCCPELRLLWGPSWKVVGEDLYQSFAVRTWCYKSALCFSWDHQCSWWCLWLCLAHLMFQVRTEPFVGT